MSNINTKNKEFTVEVESQSAEVFANLIRQQLLVGGDCWRITAFKFSKEIPWDSLQVEKVLNGTRVVVENTTEDIVKFELASKSDKLIVSDLENASNPSGAKITVVGTHNIYLPNGNVDSNRKEILAQFLPNDSVSMTIICVKDNGYVSGLSNASLLKEKLNLSDLDICSYSIMNTYHRLFTAVSFDIHEVEDNPKMSYVKFNIQSMTSSSEELETEINKIMNSVGDSLITIAGALKAVK